MTACADPASLAMSGVSNIIAIDSDKTASYHAMPCASSRATIVPS